MTTLLVAPASPPSYARDPSARDTSAADASVGDALARRGEAPYPVPRRHHASSPVPRRDGARVGDLIVDVAVDDGARVDDRERIEFDAFVQARLPHLLRFGHVITGSQDAAADLVQDALERTLLAWHRLDRRDEPEGYVRRIMVNRNISLWRKFGREYPTDAVRDAGVEDRRHDHDLWRAVQSLPPRQRAVIALRYYEDLSEAQIADTLGCSVGTVKSQASKAIAKLRTTIPMDER